MQKRIYILNTSGYFGGTLVLSVLCKTLRELKYDARILVIPYLPKQYVSRNRFVYDCITKNAKHLIKNFIKMIVAFFLPHAKFVKYFRSSANVLKINGIKLQWHPFINKENSIVIYPEYIYGNPLNAKYVVRWLLYFYNYLDDKNAYSSKDLFIAYREIYNNEILNKDKYIVNINYFNHQLYRQYNFGERKGKCYIIHKGWNRSDLPKEFDGPVYTTKMTQEELVSMLNTYKYCYCYDSQTFYMNIAAICGCIPILVMEEGKTEKDYLGPNEAHYGIAYGDSPEQIEFAITTRDKCIMSLDYSDQNIKNALHLIDILEKRFGKIIKKY